MKETHVIFDWQSFLFAIFGIVIAVLIISLYVVPVKMANKRGRSGVLWFLFSLLISPILSMIFLALLGETDDKRRTRIIEEEELRMRYRS